MRIRWLKCSCFTLAVAAACAHATAQTVEVDSSTNERTPGIFRLANQTDLSRLTPKPIESGSETEQPLLIHQVGCNDSCPPVCPPPVCCAPPWAHDSGVFGELMFLRARDSEITYALPVNGAVPEGPVGLLDPDFDLGFRIGSTLAVDNCSSFVFTYSHYDSGTNGVATAAAPLSLSKALVHPNALNAAANVPTANGDYDIDFRLIDLEYRFILLASELTAINLSVGARYGILDQELTVVYAGAGLVEAVTTDVEFEGAGIRLGADIERHGSHGLFAYGKSNASFLAGEFTASYLHSSNVDPVVAASSWKAGRIMSILELEVGAGWQCSDCWRISTGYMVSSWMGAVKTDDWINGVRNNAENYRDLSDSLTFDGLVARVECRY